MFYSKGPEALEILPAQFQQMVIITYCKHHNAQHNNKNVTQHYGPRHADRHI
jgi:hypothetical protein